MQAAGVWKGQLCLPVARFFHRHAYSSKLRTSPLYRTAWISGLQFDKLKLQPSHGLLRVSSSVEECTQQNDAGTKVVKVKFVLQRRCEFGQQFCVTGDDELLGEWAPEAAIPMQWSEGHIWTVELDLSVGMCMEFKIILMAEQEIVEWQPGQNHVVELSSASSSLVVLVPWSDEENDLEKEPQVDTVINEFVRTQDGDETASSPGNPPDSVEDMEFETFSNKSVDVTEEHLSEERSTASGMVKINAKRKIISIKKHPKDIGLKDVLDEQQKEAKGIVTGDQEGTDARTRTSSELKSSKFTLPFAIPESWYGEEFEQMSEISSSHDSTKYSPVSVEDIAKGETVSSDFKFSNDNKEAENGEELMSLNGPDEAISEGRASSLSEPITKDENDEERRVQDVLVEATSPRNVGTSLSDTKLKDTSEETTKKHIVQNGPVEVIAESRSETTTSTTKNSNNHDQSDKEVLVDNDPTVLISEVPEIEKPSMGTDSLEKVETKPSMTDKEKKRGPKRWYKLWDAFVQGRIN